MALDAPMGPPPIEIVFSFDTTGSMCSVLDTVRKNLQDVITRLFKDIPNLRIALIAHGDYCDATCGNNGHYVIKTLDFTCDVKVLCAFANKVSSTCGGDYPECYELALWTAFHELSWAPCTQRAMVVIGDAIPHEAKEAQNTKNIDWKQQADDLFSAGVRLYGVQCQKNTGAEKFYKELAKRTHGSYLNLAQFETIVDMFMAICYREHGAEYFNAFEKEIRLREGPGMRRELVNMFDTLRDDEAGSDEAGSDDTEPPPADTVVTPAKVLKKKGRKVATKTPVAKKLTTAARATKTKVSALPPKARKLAKGTAVKKATTTRSRRTKSVLPLDQRKYLREIVPQTLFTLKQLNWSPWKLAMANGDKEPGRFEARRQKRFGYRKTSLFANDTRCPAVYEVAVQPKYRSRLYVMYVKITKGFTSSLHWDTYLLRHPSILPQLDDVLKQGCKVYVRRALINKTVKIRYSRETLNNQEEVKRYLAKNFDYAWNKGLCGKKRHRHIVKNGVVLSDQKY